MARHVLAAAVVVADTAMLIGRHDDLALWVFALYAIAIALVVVLRHRSPSAAFAAALALALITGGGYALLLWTAYQAGHAVTSRKDAAMVGGAAAGGLVVQLAVLPADAHEAARLVTTTLVFVALPLLAGRYLAQHRRLVATLDQHNRQLLREREIVADRERLRERLRIARDMHDSVGHRLGLASVQAAALQVSPLDPPQRQTVEQLAAAVRGAADDLHELVAALRVGDEGPAPGAEAIDPLVAEFEAAGVPVTLRGQGRPCPLSAAAGRAAYRVVEEGLTNAAKHAPGRPVTVHLHWEADALLVTVVNALPEPGRATVGGEPGGHGLRGLSERVRPVGGLVDSGPAGGTFRLVAMFPAATAATGDRVEDAPDDRGRPARRASTAVLGAAVAAFVFVVTPASMLVGAI